MSAANAAVKKKPNLTAVTPMSAPPPSLPDVDTTTPMDTSVLPFGQIDLPKWGAWLIEYIGIHWPGITPFNGPGILTQIMTDNTCIFLKAKKAILLASWHRELLDPRPIVNIVFCFKHNRDDHEQDKDVRLLFQRTQEWAKNIGARKIVIQKPEAVDLTPSRLKEVFWGEQELVWTKDLDK